MPERLPDLAHEGDDRSLAAGAGDGSDGRRLARMEMRGGERQRAARVAHAHERGLGRQCDLPLAHDRHRAGGDGIGDETRTVGAAAGERNEDVARLHVAAVGGNAGDFERAEARLECGISGQHFAQLHGRDRTLEPGNQGSPGVNPLSALRPRFPV